MCSINPSVFLDYVKQSLIEILSSKNFALLLFQASSIYTTYIANILSIILSTTNCIVLKTQVIISQTVHVNASATNHIIYDVTPYTRYTVLMYSVITSNTNEDIRSTASPIRCKTFNKGKPNNLFIRRKS